MNIDRALHVLNALALLIAALYFVFRLEANSELLAQKLIAIDNKLMAHSNTGAHVEAREDITELSIAVGKLHEVVKINQRNIDRHH